jgi:hypothetical protein
LVNRLMGGWFPMAVWNRYGVHGRSRHGQPAGDLHGIEPIRHRSRTTCRTTSGGVLAGQ